MIGFTKRLLADLQDMPDGIACSLEQLRRADILCIWGTGVAGQMICKSAVKRGIRPNLFINGSLPAGTQENLLGIPVISPENIPEQAFIIIAADRKYGIHNIIEKRYHNPYCYIDPLLFSQYSDDRKQCVMKRYAEASDRIDRVFSALSDERGKQTFRNVLIHRAVHRLELLWAVYEKNQYFGNDLIAETGGGFADCGAYTGDTLRAFIGQIGDRDYYYYAFEPEQENYLALRNYVTEKEIGNVQVFDLGLWDRKDTLRFVENEAGDTLAWKLGDTGGKDAGAIKVDSLDNVLQGREIGFIKMDIEGSELRALEGARKIIESCKPVLAISSYHELEHLWEVPLKMLELLPGCRLSCRHHSWNMADTVCYGI
ncbi:MAG: FkbM family methyltransferase [Oscillospiraceae bacterium]|nr:FkbM family methyltransferase [Oscillospiraceae bacterium]